jgi:spore germination cell wall hydrolase CwlJ-like protein
MTDSQMPTADVEETPAAVSPARVTGRSLGRIALMLLLAVAVVVVLASIRVGPRSQPAVPIRGSRHADLPAGPPPKIEAPFAATALRPLTPDNAVAWNASVPFAGTPNPPATPFRIGKVTPEDYERSVQCLAAAVFYEADSEPIEGERAVAQVVLNRVRHPAFPHSVCGVVFEGAERPTGCQFSFTCDGSLARAPYASGWKRAREVAEKALGGYVFAPVGWSTHYHTNWVVPYWAASLAKTANVGAQIFYRWSGGWGTRPAFTAAYAGTEPTLAANSGTQDVPELQLMIPAAPAVVAAAERPVLPASSPATASASTPAAGAPRKTGEPLPVQAQGAAVPDSQRWILGVSPPPPARTAEARAGEARPLDPHAVEPRTAPAR